MLTIEKIEQTVDQLSTRQADRLLATKLGIEEFLAQPEEVAVTTEIEIYNALLAQMEATV